MIQLKTEKQIKLMAEGGKILAEILSQIAQTAKPGVTTKYLDKLAAELVLGFSRQHPDANIRPAFLNYRGYPANLCTSVNDEVVHAIPSGRVLNEGDILGLDFGIVYKTWNLDSAVTVGVGKISKKAEKLLRVTKRALEIGIAVAVAGNTLGDLGHAIQEYVESRDLSVVRDLVGHGIGKKLHEEPYVPNFGNPRDGMILKAGMVIAIEPMVTLGDWHVELVDDGWTWRTKDHSLAAHFEHTLAVTAEGPLILTKP